jgi:hypothetical protein
MAKSGDVEFVIAADDEASKVFAKFESNIQAGVAQVVQSFGKLTKGISAEVDAFGSSIDTLFALAMNPTPLGALQAGLSAVGIAFEYLGANTERSNATLAKQAAYVEQVTNAHKEAKIAIDALREKVSPTEDSDRLGTLTSKNLAAIQPRSEYKDKSKQGFWADLQQSFMEETGSWFGGNPQQQEPSAKTFRQGQETAAEDAKKQLDVEGELVAKEEYRIHIAEQNADAQKRILDAMAQQDRAAAEANARADQAIRSDEARAAAMINSVTTPAERLKKTLKDIDDLQQKDQFGIETGDLLRKKAQEDFDKATKGPAEKNTSAGSGNNLLQSHYLTGASGDKSADTQGKQLEEAKIANRRLEAIAQKLDFVAMVV